jgi:hexosaminidase
MMKKLLLSFILLFVLNATFAQSVKVDNTFAIKGFHLDLRIQVMTMEALYAFALQLKNDGINTLIIEWEGTYPFDKHPIIPNRYAYNKDQIVSFVKYCDGLGIDVIPLQQSFGHVEYILRHPRYKNLREDQKDYSQVCPLETAGDSILFSDLYSELASTHPSKYIHIGGDETYLLGHDEKCKRKAEQEGKSKLYVDYIKMLCGIVIKLGKRPVVWADIALKYPEAIKCLPKETVFVDWNYGWDMNRFGDHQVLMESGYEVWGSPSIRSWPDNYYLTQWEKHFNNIRDFVPAARKFGYKGIVITSWSTSGLYSSVFESDADVKELFAIRHVYPLSGFNILIDAFSESIETDKTLDMAAFIQDYCFKRFGFDKAQSNIFWRALKMKQYEIRQGEVMATPAMSVQQLLDSNRTAKKILYDLKPSKSKIEYEHFKLMFDIRDYYLQYQLIEKQVNGPSFNETQRVVVLNQLKQLLAISEDLNKRFESLNKHFLNPSEIIEENSLRNYKVNGLYNRLSRNK